MQIYGQLMIGTILHRKKKKERELLIIGILSINLHIKAMASNIIVNHTIGAAKSNSGKLETIYAATSITLN